MGLIKLKLEIEHCNPKMIKEVFNGMFPDTDKTHVAFSVKTHKKNINLLVVNITASDMTSLRATVNSLLRLVNMITTMENGIMNN